MNGSAQFEAFLARIYVDAEARSRFLADPRGEALRAGLSDRQAQSLENIDREGLLLASRSFAGKRSGKPRRRVSLLQWMRERFRRPA